MLLPNDVYRESFIVSMTWNAFRKLLQTFHLNLNKKIMQLKNERTAAVRNWYILKKVLIKRKIIFIRTDYMHELCSY